MPQQTRDTSPAPVIGIGACLTGREVRYNGSAKSANEYVAALAETFQIRPFCPEMAIGLGVPRPAIHLVGDEHAVRVLDVATHSDDHTDAIFDYAGQVLSLAPELCAYILVKGSPSCGYARVKRHSDKGHVLATDQQGIFAAALERNDPLLPLEDDGRLNDPALRESFVARAYAYHSWKQLQAEGISAANLIAFYSRYKYLVMAHDVNRYKTLGPLLANAGRQSLESLASQFIAGLMQALKKPATRRSHSNVLFHLSGYLKHDLSSDERQRLKNLIDQYRVGEVPLIVPVTLFKHHFANNPNDYIDQQVFLNPFPDQLRLRNAL